MKRILLAWAILGAVCGSLAADTAGKAERLEKLKKDFPAHVAGADLEKMHPVNRECFETFKKQADQLSLDILARQVVDMSQRVGWAASSNDSAARDGDNVFGSSGRSAAKRNAYWLNERVKPWLRRVALVAQGKS